VLDSDAPEFGGHGRLDPAAVYCTDGVAHHSRPASMLVYLPTRSAVVFKLCSAAAHATAAAAAAVQAAATHAVADVSGPAPTAGAGAAGPASTGGGAAGRAAERMQALWDQRAS
jgi:hypothetical protein